MNFVILSLPSFPFLGLSNVNNNEEDREDDPEKILYQVPQGVVYASEVNQGNPPDGENLVF